MRKLILFVAMLSLSACGLVYRTSSVQDGPNVQVVSLTQQSLIEANSASYAPKTLPAVFSITAPTNATAQSRPALPQPSLAPNERPASLALRPPPQVPSDTYKIGVGDVILLSSPDSENVGNTPAMVGSIINRQSFTVQDDGAINIPQVGRVRIAGLSIEDAEELIFQRLADNQFEVSFGLEVSEFRSRRASIGGAVKQPQVLNIGPDPLMLSEALAAAGGITAPDQSGASVRIYRGGTLYQLPLEDLFSRADLLNTRLVNGDSVFVDTSFQLDQAQAYFEQQIRLIELQQQSQALAVRELQNEVQLRRAELNEARQIYRAQRDLGVDDRDYVFLTGEVAAQTRFALPFGRRAHLADALFSDGQGLAPESADISQIYVLRASPNAAPTGSVTAWHLDTRSAANLVLMTQFELRPDDIIFVEQQPITKWNRAIHQLMPSIITTSPDWTN